MNKEEIDLIKYNWKQVDMTTKEIRKILLKKVFKTLTKEQIEEIRSDEQFELENLYEELNTLQDKFV